MTKYEQILGIYRCQVWTNVGCRQIPGTDGCQQIWAAAWYGQMPGMDSFYVWKYIIYQQMLVMDRCRLWTDASYEQMPVMDRYWLWTDAGFGQMPGTEIASYEPNIT